MDVMHWMVWDSSDEELWNNPTFWITLILAVGYGMWNIYDSTINILVQLHHSPALLSFPCNCLPAVPLTFWLTSGSSEVTDVVTEGCTSVWRQVERQERRRGTIPPSMAGACLLFFALLSAHRLCCWASHKSTRCFIASSFQKVNIHLKTSLIYHPYLIFDPDATDNVSVNNFCPDRTFISLLGVFLGFFSLKLRCKTLHMCNLS